MSHLLAKDGQGLQYLALLVGWNYLLGYDPVKIPRSFVKSLSLVRIPETSKRK